MAGLDPAMEGEGRGEGVFYPSRGSFVVRPPPHPGLLPEKGRRSCSELLQVYLFDGGEGDFAAEKDFADAGEAFGSIGGEETW